MCGTKVHTLLALAEVATPAKDAEKARTMSNPVNIEGLDKADVLAALYNASNPTGMGFLQAGSAPLDMDRAHAEKLLKPRSDANGDYPARAVSPEDRLYFGYLYGRPLKVDLSSVVEFDPQWFDRDNGGDGAAQRVINHLRATGSVKRADGSSFATNPMNKQDSLTFLLGAVPRRE